MLVYHALCYSWNFEIRAYMNESDLSLIPARLHAFINESGRLDVHNPCEVFPFLHFFMPWFFYKSGQLFEKRPMRELWNKDRRKLLYTFLIWSFAGYVLYVVFGLLQHSLTLKSATYSILRNFYLTGKIPLNDPLWFLMTLFMVRFISNIILPSRKSRFAWLRILAVAFFGYCAALLAYHFNNSMLPLWVANGAAGLAFFAIGYGLGNHESKWWIAAPCAAVYILCCFIGFPMVDMLYNKPLASTYTCISLPIIEYAMWIPVALCSIVTFNYVCQIISRFVSIKPLEVAGQKAMNIYTTHILIVVTITFIISYRDLAAAYPYLVWIILGAYALILPLLCMLRLTPNQKT